MNCRRKWLPVLNPIQMPARSLYSCVAAVVAAAIVAQEAAVGVDAHKARRLASSQARDHPVATAAAMVRHRVLRLHAAPAVAAAKPH